MNNILRIYSEITEKDRMNFISSCFAKQRNLFGCPRLILKDKITKDSINDLFTNHKKFQQLDEKFFPLIDNDFACLTEIGIKVLFDVCQNAFDIKDEISEFLSEDVKRHFNLNIRLLEQEKFKAANSEHYSEQKTICEKIIFDKLNEVWKHRWSNPKSYTNDLNRFNLSI
jgi:hypothetical protein